MTSNLDQGATTFLLPVRNARGYVGTSIRWALRAMSEKDRLLIIDDGSSDSTAQVISLHTREDARASILTNTRSLGVAKSLNIALEQVQTEFSARIDADDVCLPWRLRISKRRLQELNVDFLFTGAILFGSGVRFTVPSPGGFISPEKMQHLLAHNNPLIHSTLLARTSALRHLGGYRENTMAEDYDLWIRAELAGFRLAKTSLPTILFRVHEDQLTRSEDWKKNYSHPETRHALRTALGMPNQVGEAKMSNLAQQARRFVTKILFRV